MPNRVLLHRRTSADAGTPVTELVGGPEQRSQGAAVSADDLAGLSSEQQRGESAQGLCPGFDRSDALRLGSVQAKGHWLSCAPGATNDRESDPS